MDRTMYVIAGLVACGLIIFIYFKFWPKKGKMVMSQKEAEKQVKLERLRSKFVGKNMYLSKNFSILYDENHEPIDIGATEAIKIYKDISIHRDSVYSSKLPVKISEIKLCDWSDNYDFIFKFELRKEISEFEIVYCGDYDAIAKSTTLGEVYLPKKDFLQYEIGKKLKIYFDSYSQTDSTLLIINPKIVTI